MNLLREVKSDTRGYWNVPELEALLYRARKDMNVRKNIGQIKLNGADLARGVASNGDKSWMGTKTVDELKILESGEDKNKNRKTIKYVLQANADQI